MLPVIGDIDVPIDHLAAIADDTAVVCAAAADALHNPRRTDAAFSSGCWTVCGGNDRETENVAMPEDDRRPAIQATSTSALWAVAVVLAVVLLLVAAMTALDALSTARPPGAAAERVERPVRQPEQADVQSMGAARCVRS
ncbi:hypothetical protein L3Q67_01345 [Saccharothrix sp. AJ9571]|nr:hypothetical protein L3Q67_01345 [Saccharothrix sp. AJ9571]